MVAGPPDAPLDTVKHKPLDTVKKVSTSPWHIENPATCPASKPWAVVKDADKTVVGCHETEADANRQMAALYANEPKAVVVTMPGFSGPIDMVFPNPNQP